MEGVFVGEGSNGKSVVLAVLDRIFPKGSATSTPPHSWCSQGGSGEYHRAALRGRRINLVGELPEADLTESEVLKDVISGGKISARLPRGEPFEFIPRAGHIFSGNTLPAVRDSSHGFWRRFVVLTFNQTFGEDLARPFDSLVEQLVGEQRGIVVLLIEAACRAVERGTLTLVPSSKAALTEWQVEGDQVYKFFSERVEKIDQPFSDRVWSQAQYIYANYRSWAENNGHRPSLSDTSFGKRFKHLVKWKRTSKGMYYAAKIKDVGSVQGPEVDPTFDNWS